MPKTKGLLDRRIRLIVLAVIFVLAVYLIGRNIGVSGNILLVLLGFGAVIIVHEFGHFIVAKLSGIKVEVFSIFMPPTLLGVKRTEEGWRLRILPGLLPKEGDESAEGLLSFTVGKKAKAGETEYRIGLIPLGGFVKMLGQDDIGPVKESDDPRSYANKPILVRMAVIAAGVTFNALSAIIILMMVFLIGINLSPAVVGGVAPGSPAERAGLRAGDEIVEIGGRSRNLDFSDIILAAALSDVNETVLMKVKHADGTTGDYAFAAEQMEGDKLKMFGISQPLTLVVAKVTEPNELRRQTGLLPGDRIKAVNGKDVEHYWDFEQTVLNSVLSTVAVLAERKQGADGVKLVESKIGLELFQVVHFPAETEEDISQICSMVPRLKIAEVSSKRLSITGKIVSVFGRLLAGIGLAKEAADTGPKLESGDIIVRVGDVENPTYLEMREVTTQHEGKKMPVEVLRKDNKGVKQLLTVEVIPERAADSNRVVIGIAVALDAEYPVVAKTISAEGGLEPLAIPRGARIEAVDGVEVSSWYDVVRQIRSNAGRRIGISWRVDDEVAGNTVLDVNNPEDFIRVISVPREVIPFRMLERSYKASGPVDALRMGYKKTVWFVKTTYITVLRLVRGLISPQLLTGPVGIIKLSYDIVAEQPPVYHIYFLGLISSAIAVFNFLPLLPLDGGLIVLLLIEKVKGSALSERTQGIIAYVGWVFIGLLLIYVTRNDIVTYFLK